METVFHIRLNVKAPVWSPQLLLHRKSKEVEKILEETQKTIRELAENINQAKVTLQQTSAWVSVKFSSLIKVLAEKQQATELFIDEQREAAITEAEARLAELEENTHRLRESQDHIAALHHLPDTELIKESLHVEVPRFKDVHTDVCPNLQERLSGITDVLSRISKLVSEDLDKAVSMTVGQDRDGSPQDKRPVLAVVPSPAAPCHPGGRRASAPTDAL
ncbi:hypothetical protein INR49_008027 [Caranx melampygus]|nr:hypothetical protein INR49_008027 [Caranx melampygus]